MMVSSIVFLLTKKKISQRALVLLGTQKNVDGKLKKSTSLTAMQERTKSIESSRLTNLNVDLPAPQGLEYLPFQKAGIAYALQRNGTLIADEMGLGKAQPLDAKVLTPNGWMLMRNIKIGDEIINSLGDVSKVTDIYPQGRKKVFKVEFTDGSSTE